MFPLLAQLNLAGNEITQMSTLTPLFALKHLQELDLRDNPVTELANYRPTLLKYPSIHPAYPPYRCWTALTAAGGRCRRTRTRSRNSRRKRGRRRSAASSDVALVHKLSLVGGQPQGAPVVGYLALQPTALPLSGVVGRVGGRFLLESALHVEPVSQPHLHETVLPAAPLGHLGQQVVGTQQEQLLD